MFLEFLCSKGSKFIFINVVSRIPSISEKKYKRKSYSKLLQTTFRIEVANEKNVFFFIQVASFQIVEKLTLQYNLVVPHKIKKLRCFN